MRELTISEFSRKPAFVFCFFYKFRQFALKARVNQIR